MQVAVDNAHVRVTYDATHEAAARVFQCGQEGPSLFEWYYSIVTNTEVNYSYVIGEYTIRIVQFANCYVKFIDHLVTMQARPLLLNASNIKWAAPDLVAQRKLVGFNKEPQQFKDGDVVVSTNDRDVYYCSEGKYYRALWDHPELTNQIVLRNSQCTREEIVHITGLKHEF